MSNFVIDTLPKLSDKLNLIQSLTDIEIATKILDDTKGLSEDIWDVHYGKLDCKIKHIKPSESIYPILEEYLKNTSSDNTYQKVSLLEAYELQKESIFKDHGNKKLLWHGSRITNFVGILSQGLRIAPPEAPSTGYLFGKGVYFADMASKSICYCSPANGIALILLCEVSLGNPNEKTTSDYKAADLPNGKHSTHALGQTIPSEEIFLGDIAVPKGKPIKNPKQVKLLF